MTLRVELAGSCSPRAGAAAIPRPRLTVDLEAIAANWRALGALSAPAVETAAVVKADAYGLGAARVAPALAAAGARTFFVATVEEGAALRAALGPGPAVHVFAGLMPGDAAACARHDLVPSLNDAGQVEALLKVAPRGRCAIQLDTGMNRLGMEPSDLAAVAEAIGRLRPVLAFSHLACADEPGHPVNARQAEAFAALRARQPGIRGSLAATGGILLGPGFHHDLVRPGIGLYGGLPFAAARPVASLALPVLQVRDVAPGEIVGYGAAWTAGRPSRVATLGAGYADGLPRGLAGRGVRLFAGARACPMIGRVSMDLVTADVTDLPEVPDHLEILNAQQTVDDLAAAAGTIGYEILTGLGGRIERVYKGAATSGPA